MITGPALALDVVVVLHCSVLVTFTLVYGSAVSSRGPIKLVLNLITFSVGFKFDHVFLFDV